MDTSRSLVEVDALTKKYGALSALEDCTVGVRSREVFGLLGPNGAGKTTLLRLLLGYLRPTRGRAVIDGRDCWRESVAVHRGVSYLPGDVRLARGMKGRQVLEFFARLRGHDVARSLKLAERLGLDLSRKVAQMSTGMRQKLAVAAVLAVDVPLLVLDEPTSNLDPTVRQMVLGLIREARGEGRTVIFSSHVLSEVEQVSDRVAILRAGRLVHDQAMSQIRRRHRIRARLTGAFFQGSNTGALPQPPEALRAELHVTLESGGYVTIDAPGDLASLLGWLSTLPLAEVHIEPIGLQAVYEQYHPLEPAGGAEAAA